MDELSYIAMLLCLAVVVYWYARSEQEATRGAQGFLAMREEAAGQTREETGYSVKSRTAAAAGETVPVGRASGSRLAELKELARKAPSGDIVYGEGDQAVYRLGAFGRRASVRDYYVEPDALGGKFKARAEAGRAYRAKARRSYAARDERAGGEGKAPSYTRY